MNLWDRLNHGIISWPFPFQHHLMTGYPDKIPPEKIPFNAVERETVPTRVLNLNASEASYKPKQGRNRKTKLTFFFSG